MSPSGLTESSLGMGGNRGAVSGASEVWAAAAASGGSAGSRAVGGASGGWTPALATLYVTGLAAQTPLSILAHLSRSSVEALVAFLVRCATNIVWQQLGPLLNRRFQDPSKMFYLVLHHILPLADSRKT